MKMNTSNQIIHCYLKYNALRSDLICRIIFEIPDIFNGQEPSRKGTGLPAGYADEWVSSSTAIIFLAGIAILNYDLRSITG
jgi:hypothetical protein